VDRILEMDDAVRSFVVVSATGYGRRFPIADADSMLLATRAGERPLSVGHGFPARLVAPGRRGFWWVKWIERIETSGTPWWWQSPFPLT
jgi:DMSO/TMAO reductase YedYZ molybdopterin-dependent catalytic subunit